MIQSTIDEACSACSGLCPAPLHLLLSWPLHCWHRRLDVTTTVFRTSLFGLIALIAAYGFASRLVFVETWWTTFSPVHDRGTPFFACVLGAVLWLPLNLLFPYQSALALLHERNSTDELDAFLHKATQDKALVQLSLSGGKFHMGNIQQLPPNPAAAKAYVRALPMMARCTWRFRRWRIVWPVGSPPLRC